MPSGELYLERAEMHLGAIYTRHTLCRTTRLDWYLNLLNVKTSPQAKSKEMHKYKYKSKNTIIPIPYILKAKKFAEPLFQSKKIAEKVRKSGRHFWAI